MADESIKWRAPEYRYYRKSNDWYWTLGIITIGFAISAILVKNFLFGLLILIGGFSLALYGARKPDIISFSIDSKGITIGKNLYPYENLKSFWIAYDPPRKKELLIESQKTFMPQISIMLGDSNPEQIREYLLKYLKEEKKEESLITTVAGILKF